MSGQVRRLTALGARTLRAEVGVGCLAGAIASAMKAGLAIAATSGRSPTGTRRWQTGAEESPARRSPTTLVSSSQTSRKAASTSRLGNMPPLLNGAHSSSARTTVACGSNALRNPEMALQQTLLQCAPTVGVHGRGSANGSITNQDFWPSLDLASIAASATQFALPAKVRIASVGRRQRKSNKDGVTMAQG